MERLRSDHPTIPTHTGAVIRYGSRRRALAISHDELFSETVVRIIADETEWFTQPIREQGQRWVISGLYTQPGAAREYDQTETKLADWLEKRDLSPGRTVFVDVIDEGVKYGLRGPGEDAVYQVPDQSAAGLVDIAREIDPSTDE